MTPPQLQQGGLGAKYMFDHMHIHWGSNQSGSEHILNKRQYPLEIHLVHNKKGVSDTDAVTSATGFAVLGLFVDIARHDDYVNPYVVTLIDAIEMVSNPSTYSTSCPI